MLSFCASLKSFEEPGIIDEGFRDFLNREGIMLMENIVQLAALGLHGDPFRWSIEEP